MLIVERRTHNMEHNNIMVDTDRNRLLGRIRLRALAYMVYVFNTGYNKHCNSTFSEHYII